MSGEGALEPIRRPRLIERLNELAGHPLVIIRGRFGSGKTTMLDQWIEQFDGGDVVRVVIDSPELRPMVRSMLMHADRLDPGRADLALQLQDRGRLHRTDVDSLIDGSGIERPVWMIIDDPAGMLSEAQAEVIDWIVHASHPDVHLIVSSRREVPLSLGSLVSVGEIGEADLAFTDGELADVIEGHLGRPAAAEEVRALQDESGGWLAAQVAAVAGGGETPVSPVTLAVAVRQVETLVGVGIVGALDADDRDFLVEASALGELSPRVCDEILQRRDSALRLDSIRRATPVLAVDDLRQETYRLDPLVRTTLWDRLQRGDPARAVELTSAVSESMVRRGRVLEGVQRLVEQRLWPDALNLVAVQLRNLNDRDKLVRASELVACIPDSELRAHPFGLHVSMIIAIALGDVNVANARIAEVSRNLETGSDFEWLDRVVVHAAGAVVGRWQDNSETAFADAETALELLADVPEPIEALFGSGMVSWIRGLVTLSGGTLLGYMDRTDEARTWLVRVEEGISTQPELAGRAIAERALLDVADGRLTRAVALAGQVDRIADGLTFSMDIRLEAEVARAVIAVERGALDDAERSLETAERLLAVRWPPVARARILVVRARIDLARKNLRRGMVRFDTWRRQDWAPIPAVVERAMRRAEARLAVAYDQVDYAKTLAHPGGGVTDIPDVAALIAVVQGDDRGLAVVLDTWPRSERLEDRIRYELFRALQAHRGNRPDVVSHHLDRAVRLAEPEGFVRVFVDASPGVMDLVRAESSPDSTQRLEALVNRVEEVTGERGRQTSELFSPREAEILALLPTHLEAADIAQRLDISVSTLKSHLKRIYRKLGVHKRGDAVDRASEMGLIRTPSS